MIDSPLAARYEMAEMLGRGWALADWAGMGLSAAPEMRYQGREKPEPPPVNLPFARFSLHHADADQESLAGEQGQRKWSRYGTLVVQCFGATSGGKALEDATNMATIAQRIYQGKQSAGCIWFRNVAVKEIGTSGGWYQVNLTASFEYDEVR